MGCTSGAARIRDEKGDRMQHFRTLDWGMDKLRKLVVRLEYVNGEERVGTAVGYVGFVGVLTAVRKDLSISLNFRPNRDCSSFGANVAFYWHLFLVLMGFRAAVASTLRSSFFEMQKELTERAHGLSTVNSTACYVTLCDGDSAIVLEKDLKSARIREESDFITVTNHDLAYEQVNGEDVNWNRTSARVTGIEDFVADSTNRKNKVCNLWKSAVARNGGRKAIDQKTVQKWMEVDPIKNESTHLALVMDPKMGKITYLKRYLEPYL
jgi:hypothetical protein